MSRRLLYVTWDGPGPNYLESLFIPIFARVQELTGASFAILQYSWDAEERSRSIADVAARHHMQYVSRRVPPGPQGPATLGGVLAGARDVAGLTRALRIDTIVPRSIVPAAMCLFAMRRRRGVDLMYDADGLKADERADFAGWPRKGVPYRLLSRIEASAVERSSAIVTRTARTVELLAERLPTAGVEAKAFVTCNGKDEEVFTPGTAAERSGMRWELGFADNDPVVAYVGSLGPQYLPEAMVAFFGAVHRQEQASRFVVLTPHRADAEQALTQAGIPADAFRVLTVAPDQVPRHLRIADVGLAFRVPSLSQAAVAPIKVGEYLMSGVPVLSSRGIGDLDAQLDERSGRLVDPRGPGAVEESARWFLERVVPERAQYRTQSRQAGIERFSLRQAAEQFTEALAFVARSGGRHAA